jgi:hypothetical protein
MIPQGPPVILREAPRRDSASRAAPWRRPKNLARLRRRRPSGRPLARERRGVKDCAGDSILQGPPVILREAPLRDSASRAAPWRRPKNLARLRRRRSSGRPLARERRGVKDRAGDSILRGPPVILREAPRHGADRRIWLGYGTAGRAGGPARGSIVTAKQSAERTPPSEGAEGLCRGFFS